MGEEDVFEAFRSQDSDQVTLVIERGFIEPGKSFSVEAIEVVRNQLILFIGARLMAAWDKRGVPPTRCKINMEMEIQ